MERSLLKEVFEKGPFLEIPESENFETLESWQTGEKKENLGTRASRDSRRLKNYPVQNWSLEIPQEPPSDSNPRCWMKFLDPWVQDLYPLLGWGLAPS